MRSTILLLAAGALGACQAAVPGAPIRPEFLTEAPIPTGAARASGSGAPAAPGPWIKVSGASGAASYARVVAGAAVRPGETEARLALPALGAAVRAYRLREGQALWEAAESEREAAGLTVRWPAAMRALLAFGDPAAAASVTMAVCGAVYEAPGATVIGALIERSSDPAYEMKGLSGLVLARGGFWRDDDGAYRVPGRPDFVRETVRTEAYTGSAYRLAHAPTLAGWDGEGAFALSLPPGSAFVLDAPEYLGLAGDRRTGTTLGAPLPPFDPAQPHAIPSVTGLVAPPPCHVAPIFYATDATLTIRAPGLGGAIAGVRGRLDGEPVSREAAGDGQGSFRLTFSRRADGRAQRFVLERLETATGARAGEGEQALLPVGGRATLTLAEPESASPELPK